MIRKRSYKRRILITAIFAFILGVVAPVMVLFSLGYRFDRDKGVVVYSGTIVLKTTPGSVNINLNDKPAPESTIDFINRAYNVGGLRPGHYKIEVNAAESSSWKKEVRVQSGIATEFWNVVLVPNKLDQRVIEDGKILGYAFSPDKKKLAYFTERDGELAIFVNTGGNEVLVHSETYNQKLIPSAGELKWSPDNRYLIFSIKKNNKEYIFLTGEEYNYSEITPLSFFWQQFLDLKNAKNIMTGFVDKEGVKSKYEWDRNNIYFTYDKKLYRQNLASLISRWVEYQENKNIDFRVDELQPFKLTDNASNFTLCGDLVCAVNTPNLKVEFFNKDGGVESEVLMSSDYDPIDKYKVYAYGDDRLALVDGDENLFLWDEENLNKGFQFIFSGVKEAYFSDDGKKLLFSTSQEVYVYFLREWEVQPKHIKGDLDLVYKQAGNIKNVQWYKDYQHIFVINENEIILVELDGRGGRNIFSFFEAPFINSAIYDTREEKFWLLEGDTSREENPVSSGERLKEIVFPVSANILPSFGRENTSSE